MLPPMRLLRASLLALVPLIASPLVGCKATPPPPAPKHHTYAREVFDAIAPSVVAVLNDDKKEREDEEKELLKSLGDESKAPKKIIDVSLRKEQTPHGTGFVVEGGNVVTAAHVVHRPDKLRIWTRKGQSVEAELVNLDEYRDVAVLRPKEPLKDTPPVKLDDGDVVPGEQVWAMGHTGQGLWALSWGISEGIASGVVDLHGVKTLVFDASVYPGFSGGPVIRRDAAGQPRVIGVNHAILFTGGFMPVATISSATNISELREVVANKRHPMEKKLADYAKAHNEKQWADLFITNALSVHRDAHGLPVAEIFGHRKAIDVQGDSTSIPVVAMVFNVPKGEREVVFEVKDPEGKVVATVTRPLSVPEKQRVSFVSASVPLQPKHHGRYEVVAKHEGKTIGTATVNLSLADDDHELVDDHDTDVSEDGDPDVDIVVAQFGNPEPLILGGVRAGWAEKSYPRRVAFTWFARGTRGWSGTDVAITAFVLDKDGRIVGTSTGCYRPVLRPEHPWACMGTGGSPLTLAEGQYDVVFAINDRPVAVWPMEATIRAEQAPGSDVERWLKDMKRKKQRMKPADAPPPPPATTAPPAKGGAKAPPPPPTKPRK